MRRLGGIAIVTATLAGSAHAQAPALPPDYSTQGEVLLGTAPGMKVTELGPHRSFQITLTKGDDVRAGLLDFAVKNHVTNAHFTAIGALGSALIGWSDPARGNAFKTVRLDEEMEVTSLTGNITRNRNGDPVVHVHCVVALLRNGAVTAGHLLRGRVSITMQIYLDDAAPLAASAAAQ
jgi:predicted DNA-binding protein with PD1-like motif